MTDAIETVRKQCPDEWQLVPKEPTSPMFFAWTEWMVKNTSDKMSFGEFLRDYRAMLAAAPQPLVAEQQTEKT